MSTQMGPVLVLTLVILVVTKLCLTGGRWTKAPPATPPTPRLTQVDSRHPSCNYDLTVSCVQFDLVDSPGADTEDQETESCRLTVSRDGSPYGLGAGAGACQGCRGCSGACPHQCSTCHHSAYTGLYGCTASSHAHLAPFSHHGGSVMGVRSVATPLATPLLGTPDYSTYGECWCVVTRKVETEVRSAEMLICHSHTRHSGIKWPTEYLLWSPSAHYLYYLLRRFLT